MMDPENEEIELAELQRAVLDESTLDALLSDIAALCLLQGIAFKSGAEVYADDVVRSMDDVKPALVCGTAVQLRYTFRGDRWCDTLLPGMTGTLLVRMRERQA
jgi:hypothetical protein